MRLMSRAPPPHQPPSFTHTKAFSMLKDCQLQPTIYTYTNLINACVRCFETGKAEELLVEMKQRGVAPNEVTYTALIKGLCQDGSLEVCALVSLLHISKYFLLFSLFDSSLLFFFP